MLGKRERSSACGILGRIDRFFAFGPHCRGVFPALAGTTGTVTGTVVTRQRRRSPAQASRDQPVAVRDGFDRRVRPLLAAFAGPRHVHVRRSSKQGYETATTTGISVFADQAQSLRFRLGPALKTIATVTTRSSMDVVKPGTTSDVYSVNATVTQPRPASAAAAI